MSDHLYARIDIPYLIDQQASHRLVVGIITKPTYQPIVFGEEGGDPVYLSREQALAAAKALKEMALRVPAPEPNIEYPGKLLE